MSGVPEGTTDAEHGVEVRARLAAATPGLWRADDEHGLMEGTNPSWVVSLTDEGGETYLGDLAYIPHDHGLPDGEPAPQEEANAELIAHAPTDLARLIDRAERAEAALATAWEEGRTTGRHGRQGRTGRSGNPYLRSDDA